MKRGHYETEAILLESFDLGESDRILSFCTKDFGKVKGVAKGARRSRRRFVGRLEPATHLRLFFHYSEKSELVRVDDAALIEGFSELGEDIERFAVVCYLLELTGAFTRPGLSQPAVFELLRGFVQLMAGGGDTTLLARFFEVKLLSILGYMPGFGGCVSCGAAMARGGEAPSRLAFSTQKGGILCSACAALDPATMAMSAGTAKFMQAVERMSTGNLKRLRPGPFFASEAGPILDRFITARLGHGLKTRAFMEQMKNLQTAAL